jgi:hypothetical protein
VCGRFGLDGRLRPKHVVKEKGECIYEIELHCDGNSDIVKDCGITDLLNFRITGFLASYRLKSPNSFLEHPRV